MISLKEMKLATSALCQALLVLMKDLLEIIDRRLGDFGRASIRVQLFLGLREPRQEFL